MVYISSNGEVEIRIVLQGICFLLCHNKLQRTIVRDSPLRARSRNPLGAPWPFWQIATGVTNVSKRTIVPGPCTYWLARHVPRLAPLAGLPVVAHAREAVLGAPHTS